MVPKPRKIHIVAGRSCDIFTAYTDNIECYQVRMSCWISLVCELSHCFQALQEDTLVPGLTLKTVHQWFVERFQNHSQSTRSAVLHRTPWYFQQFLKLAVAAHIPNLSDHFLILDSDMVLLRPISWFMPLDDEDVSDLDPLPFPAALAVEPATESSRKCVNPHPFRTLMHIGGWGSEAYHQTYSYLTGKELIGAHTSASLEHGYTGKSLVTHNILVYKQYMAEFLGNITRPEYKDEPNGWALSVADAVATLQTELSVGFSEYWSYLSWVLENYPCTVMQAERREWTRLPLKYPSAMPKEGFVAAVPYKDTFVPVCCPMPKDVRHAASKGYFYMGYELGHFTNCNFHHEAFKGSYVEWFLAVDV